MSNKREEYLKAKKIISEYEEINDEDLVKCFILVKDDCHIVVEDEDMANSMTQVNMKE